MRIDECGVESQGVPCAGDGEITKRISVEGQVIRQNCVRHAESGVSAREVWIVRNRLLEVVDRAQKIRAAAFLPEIVPLEIEIVCGEICRSATRISDRRCCCAAKRGLQCVHYLLCELILHLKHIRRPALKCVRPDDKAVLRARQLCSDAKPVAGATHGSFYDTANVQSTTDLLCRYVLSLECVR